MSDLIDPEPLIMDIRGKKVILDEDLARLYGVETKRLNEQVSRNKGRFPEDFVFRLNYKEKSEAVANCDRLGKTLYSSVFPNAFTEHGALMAAMVLRSPRATEASVWVVRAFVKMRSILADHNLIVEKIRELDGRVKDHDEAFETVFDTLRRMVEKLPVSEKTRKIGFK